MADDLLARARARARANLFWRHLGIEVDEAEPGRVRLRVPVRDELRNAAGAPVHGGVYSALVDTAVGGALRTLFERGLRRRNRILGGGSEGGRSPPPRVILGEVRKGGEAPLRVKSELRRPRRDGRRSPLGPELARGLRVRLPDGRRQSRPELLVEPAQFIQGLEPLVTVTAKRFFEPGGRDIQAAGVDGREGRDIPDRGLPGFCLAADPLDDPLEDPHVLAVAGPEEPAPAVAAEPVHAEDPGRLGEPAPDVEPVAEV